MRKLSKVLSILLAMVLIFTTASIGVEAQYYAYKDTDLVYDSIDQPMLSVEQYASMAMDEVDRMLMKENIVLSYEIFGMTLTGDFSTIDKSLDSIATILNSFGKFLSTIGGDVDDLDFSALCNTWTDSSGTFHASLSCPHRDSAGASDLDIFRAVFEFLNDNAEILAKVPKGSVSNGGLDLGGLSSFIDLGDKLNVPELAKKAIAKALDPNYKADTFDINKTLDTYVTDFLGMILGGTYPKSGNGTLYFISQEVKEYFPNIMSQIDFMNDSVYDVVEKGVRALLDSQKAMDFINRTVQRWLHQFCGYAYIKTPGSNGRNVYTRDPANDDINTDYERLVNLNFSLSSFNTSTWSSSSTFIDHLNDILGKIVEAAFSTEAQISWNYSNGNNGLFANIRAAVEKVLEYTGTGLFASYVEVLSIDQVKALTDDQFVAYILRSIMNGSIDSVYIQSDVNTTLGVLFETVKSLAGEVVPSQSYESMSVSLDNLVQMGLDIAAAGLKGYTNLDLPYGLELDEFVKRLMNWVKEQYGGFVSDISGEGWTAANDVFFTVVPADWLPTESDGSPKDDLRSIIFDDIIDNILDFNLPALLGLFSKNSTGELNNSIIQVLISRVIATVNYVIPGSFPDFDEYDYSQLENLLNTTFLGNVVYGLLTNLYDRFDDLAESLLPLLCSVLDLSTPEEFGYPYVSLSDNTLLDPTLVNTFYVFNGSSGINSAWTDKYGNTSRDALYKYYINSITTDNEDVTVSTESGASPSGIYINGGRSQNFKFNDLDAADETVLAVTINYDVYGETGQKMTPSALTTTSYVYVSSREDDGSSKSSTSKRDANTANMHVIYMPSCVYMKSGATVRDLADVSFEIRRNPTGSSSSHASKANVRPTSVTLDSRLSALGVTANTTFKVETKKDGGSYDFKPYLVEDNNKAELENALYSTNMTIVADATQDSIERWTLAHRVFVYDDYNLASYLRSAVNADRQQVNFGTGNYTAEYIPFASLADISDDATQEELDALKVTTTVNGADAWEAYVEAIKEAAALIYAPRMWNTFATDGGTYEEFESVAEALYNATQEIEACSEGSGAAGVENALHAIIPDDTFVATNDDGSIKYDDEGNEIRERYDYYDSRYTYFGRADYVSYTYSRFKPEKRAAENIIDRWKDELKGKDVEPVSAIEAAYATHRLNLYASRLIRVIAYKQHLNNAIQKYKSIYDAGQQDFSTSTWTDFVTAYNFATTVNAMNVGSRVSSKSENLAGEGVRQTMVNEARGQLIKAAKKLVVGEDEVDKTLLEQAINNNRATYNAGAANWTTASWTAFKTAYENAVAVKNNADATQAEVDAARSALITKAAQLEANADEGAIEFDEIDGVQPVLIESEDSGNLFMVGLNEDYLDSLDDFVVTSGGYTYEIVENETMDWYSTGAQFIIYDANGDEVATYTLVLFGDVTGEGMADVDDAMVLISIVCLEEVGDWQYCDCSDEYAESFAADICHDSMLDVNDAMVLIAQISHDATINQNWTCYDDPDTI